jgi:hypothetical protein
MPRNKVPTAVLDAKGAFIANPQRERKAEPKTTDAGPIGSAPTRLTQDQKKVWKEIAKRMLPGVVFASDRDAFELMVRLTVRMRAEDHTKEETIMAAAEKTLLVSLWSRFAMTPADRSRVQAEKKPEDKLTTFLSRNPSRIVQ